MIDFPYSGKISAANPRRISTGIVQRGIASVDQIPRKGTRYAVSFTTAPLQANKAQEVLSALLAAEEDGLRIPYPLQFPQSGAGFPVLDGAVSTGHSINLRNVNPGYVCRSGFWLSLENAAGQHFLHNVRTAARANAAGELTLVLNEMVRDEFADGAQVHLAKPMVEGITLEEGQSWSLVPAHITGFQFTVEEKQ